MRSRATSTRLSPCSEQVRQRRLAGDAGAATTEAVIVAPLVLFTLLLIVQLGLYFHAMNVASAAAQEGAHEASLRAAAGGSIDPGVALQSGEQTARDFVDRFGSELLAGVAVDGSVVGDDESVRMTVSGDVSQVVVVPGLDFAISVNETALSPVERFRPAEGAPAAP
jgi:Flp pilus assembly protein TadG